MGSYENPDRRQPVSLAVEYAKILREHGIESRAAIAFRQMNFKDDVFRRRARILDVLQQIKDLGSSEASQ